MALETLIASQRAAAELTGYDIAPPDTELHELGMVTIGDDAYPAYRAHTGPSDRIAKGGIRMADYPTLEGAKGTARELSTEMLSKLGLRGYADTYKGGKGLIVVDARTLSHEDKVSAAQQFEGLMEEVGLAGYNIDVPAGDVGTNGLAGEYALERKRRHPDDELWKASITGKPPELGGLEFRTAATGWGVYAAHQCLMDTHDLTHATVAVQGFGNVGAWYAHFANEDPRGRIVISAISEYDGTLSTDDPGGLRITREMVERIGDNPRFSEQFQQSKLVEVARMLEHNQPGISLRLSNDPHEILTRPADYFVPAAMGNVINAHNVQSLGARRGIIEAANGPTMPAAHKYLVEADIDVIPDIVANGAGVDCSIKEREANIDGSEPSTSQVQADLTRATEKLMREVQTVAERLGTPDLRIAAAALSGAHVENDSTQIRELVG
jgi:glutamate dehydrogenase/leucine dehydrogenase